MTTLTINNGRSVNYVKSIACKSHFYKETRWLLVNSPLPVTMDVLQERESNRVNTSEKQVLIVKSMFLSSHQGIELPRLNFMVLCSSQQNSLAIFGCSCFWRIGGESFKVTAGKYGN